MGKGYHVGNTVMLKSIMVVLNDHGVNLGADFF
jgi:hypothetical protein